MGSTVIYTRVSKDADGTSASPAAQHAECSQEATRRGWEEPEHLSDVDLSAWSRKVVRPAWARIIAGIESGAIDGLIVHHLDRMLRQSRGLEQLLDAIESRAGKGTFPIYSVHGDIDLSNDSGRLVARILVAVAQAESDSKSRRLKLVLGAKAEQGLSHGGKVPYGWQADRVHLDPHESAVMKQLVTWTLDGMSLHEACRRLMAQGVATRVGGKWWPTTIQQMLVSPRLAGLRTHNGATYPGNWEPIIDLPTHTRLVTLFDRPSGQSTERKWWVADRLVCAECGHRMMSRGHTKGRRYTCVVAHGGCGQGIMAEPVDQIVTTLLLELLDLEWGQSHGGVDDDELVTLAENLARTEAELEQLGREFYVEKGIDRATFRAAHDPLRRSAETLRQEVEQFNRRELVPATLAESWADTIVADRIDAYRSVFDRVVIHKKPHRGKFDATRVELWMRE